jgi:hypothetical protein
VIRQISDQEVRDELAKNAKPARRGEQGWVFGEWSWHPEAEAMNITRVCLMLGQPVSDIITSQMWLALLGEMLSQQSAIEAIRDDLKKAGAAE